MTMVWFYDSHPKPQRLDETLNVIGRLCGEYGNNHKMKPLVEVESTMSLASQALHRGSLSEYYLDQLQKLPQLLKGQLAFAFRKDTDFVGAKLLSVVSELCEETLESDGVIRQSSDITLSTSSESSTQYLIQRPRCSGALGVSRRTRPLLRSM
jgi:hypothetical protein